MASEPDFSNHCKSFKECIQDGLMKIQTTLDESATEFNVAAVASLSKCMYDYVAKSVDHDPKYFSETERRTMMEIAEHAQQIHLAAMRLEQEAEDRKNNK